MLKAIIFILSFTFFVSSFGQNQIDYKNQVGIMFSDFINNSYTLFYERDVYKNFTLNMGVGYKGEDGIVKFSGLKSNVITTSNITYSGFKFTPEVRYYITDRSKSNSGFYFGLYLKYMNYNSDLRGSYLNNQKVYDVFFSGKIKIQSKGFMLGYKLPIGKRFNFDFLIAGPGSGSHSYELIQKGPIPDEFYEDLNEALNEYSFFEFLNADFRFDEVREEARFNLFSFRYGLTLNFIF